MELALLVYGVDLLMKISFSLWVALATLVTIPSLGWLYGLEEGGFTKAKEAFSSMLNIKMAIPLFVVALVIPSQQTMKYIAAGYLVQETFQSEFVQESITLSQKAVINQLQSWAEDDTEIKSLLESADIPVPKLITEKETPNEK